MGSRYHRRELKMSRHVSHPSIAEPLWQRAGFRSRAIPSCLGLQPVSPLQERDGVKGYTLKGVDTLDQKLLIILSTAEKEKAITGLLYASNVLKHVWLNDVKLCFFGPFETLLAEDEEVQHWVAQLTELQIPVACKFISDSHGVSEKLGQLGIKVEYVGELVSNYIKDGYVPMVF